MNSSKIDEILRFYLLATQLKDVVRSGRITRNIQRKRVESVAEHIYGTCILAIAIHSEFSAELEHEIDLYKVIVMLVIHELEEIVIGDLTPYDTMSPEERLRQGREAVQMVLGNLTKKAEYLALTDEFNKQTTPEARFAKMCDKLEADLQVRKYEEEGAISIERDVNNAR
ncbi:HD domain-containing protein [bacterium]|nr:HD domain-containing protein [bacterium]